MKLCTAFEICPKCEKHTAGMDDLELTALVASSNLSGVNTAADDLHTYFDNEWRGLVSEWKAVFV